MLLFCNCRYSATLTSQTYAYLLRFLESSQSHLILNILNQVSLFLANTLIYYEVRVLYILYVALSMKKKLA